MTLSYGQFKPKGTFVGVLPMKTYSDSAKPLYKWYHLSELTFKSDSVYLEQSPIAIYKKDTVFSASDGGFYYYAGTIKNYKGQTFADLTLISRFSNAQGGVIFIGKDDNGKVVGISECKLPPFSTVQK